MSSIATTKDKAIWLMIIAVVIIIVVGGVLVNMFLGENVLKDIFGFFNNIYLRVIIKRREWSWRCCSWVDMLNTFSTKRRTLQINRVAVQSTNLISLS